MSMGKPQQRMELVDYVRELTQPHPHAEHYQVRSRSNRRWVGRNHRTMVPALIAQLEANDVPSATVEEGARPGFASTPAARLEAVDALAHIGREACGWVVELGDQPRRISTADTIRQVSGLAASADDVTRKAVTNAVRRWWVQARVVTGWDSPAWTPDATCPECGERGTLKIRLNDSIGMCTYPGDASRGREACRVTWGPDAIGLLADHIRFESYAARVVRTGVGPCWCPVPMPQVPDLSRLCPSCGSSRCRHALGLRLLDSIRATATA